MKTTRVSCVIMATLLVCGVHALAAAGDVAADVRAMFESGAWRHALTKLETVPNAQSDPALRELLAMAYLYNASDLDSLGYVDKARTLMKQIVEQGGKARFFVSLGRDKKKEANLLDSTPGELVVTSSYVEFQARDGKAQNPQRWDKKDITECAANAKYGKSSNSFHLNVGRERDKSEQNFRPWHFSADESNLICSLIGVQPPARR